MLLVNIKHARELNLCAGGMRPWFKQKSLSWNDFIGEGIDADKLLATDDPMAARVVQQARKSVDG